jgi:hypothetical protein
MIDAKPFNITPQEVLTAYKQVKANKGTGGIDGIYCKRQIITRLLNNKGSRVFYSHFPLTIAKYLEHFTPFCFHRH